jgi:hypothetical protein
MGPNGEPVLVRCSTGVRQTQVGALQIRPAFSSGSWVDEIKLGEREEKLGLVSKH